MAGHRTTYGAPFSDLDKLEKRDEVVVEMPYGRFVYRVEASQIVEPDRDLGHERVGYDRLVLTACHPKYSAAQRIVIFARLARAEQSRPGHQYEPERLRTPAVPGLAARSSQRSEAEERL